MITIQQALETKHCPTCNLDLPISDFGIANSRPDGRNLYCKKDIRAKVAKSRIGQRNWRQLKKERQAKKDRAGQKAELSGWKLEVKKSVKNLSPVERVREAIRAGARTQLEIVLETKLHKDEIGDALAVLLLYNGEIRTEGADYSRIYLMNDQVEVDRKPCKQSVSLIELASSFGPRAKGVAA